jgi:hypothetical protein
VQLNFSLAGTRLGTHALLFICFSSNRWPDVVGTTRYEYPPGGYFVDHVEDDYVQ